jgi:Dyp-type peroxidase family
MATTKYFEGVLKAQREQKPVEQLPPFDMERARSKGLRGRLLSRLLENPRWILALLRRWLPIVKIGPILLVTRNDDVREVLERQDVFQTPFGPEMKEMAGGSNFVLGMHDGEDYRRMKSAVLTAFPPEEAETVVGPIAARHSREIMLRAGPGFDAVGDLLNVVPVRICRDYFGMVIEDEKEFADWSIALSSLFFADPFGSPVTRQLAAVAADRMRRLIDRSIEAARSTSADPNTPLSRLVAMHDRNPQQPSLADIHAIMMGMMTGFAPTNLLAAGNALDLILSRDDARRSVDEALAAGDDGLLDRAILEAMRFKPINIGPTRYAARDTVIADGTRRRREVKAGTTVMAGTWSAMFDPEAVGDPERFDTDRPARDYLVFGHGIHWCIGSAIARVQIREAFRAIFDKPNLRRASGAAGRLKRRGAFPESLGIDFDLPSGNRLARHGLVTVAVPVAAERDHAALRDALDALGNPAGQAVRDALDRAGTIHFASIALFCAPDPDDPAIQTAGHLVFEISGDGDEDDVLSAFAAHAGETIRPVLAAASGLSGEGDVRALLARHRIGVSPGLKDHAGLLFSGTPGHSVRRIKAEAALEQAVSVIVAEVSRGKERHASAILGETRRRLAGMGGHDWAFQPAESELEKKGGSYSTIAASAASSRIIAAVLALLLVGGVAINYFFVFGGYAPGFFRNVLVVSASALMTIVGTLIIVAIAVGSILLAVRRRERRDPVLEDGLDMARYEEIVRRENFTAQNHLTAVSTMKAGLLRRLSLRFAFFVISLFARTVFKPGHLADINTIHFARWVLLPKTDRLVFFSNYGGSWESYLEDFITKAAPGLTSVWSNTAGFPRTRFLFTQGARDGDRFKRWARCQQVPTQFWYSAYPDLNTARIRINSAMRKGLAEASTESEARAWLDLFGSIPRPANLIETDEIQGIFFGPFGPLPAAEFFAFRVSDGASRNALRDWLAWIETQTAYGDRFPEQEALTVAIGCRGLVALGLDDAAGDDLLSGFPPAFRQGMAHEARSRILDDRNGNAPQTWEWGGPANPADIVVTCYASDDSALATKVALLLDKAATAGLTLASRVPLVVKRQNGQAIEHFGFADGVSQPVVRGTPRAHRPTDPQHLVEAGEFIFGYRDERGYLPPSPVIGAAHDGAAILPAALSDGEATTALRDFGRNGSFLVVRQLEQHVDRFETYCRSAAAGLPAGPDGRSMTPEWVAAKIVGRWQDGSSLVRNPHGRPRRGPDNDFRLGTEDPQGTRCPLGSHVRRSNPRDSLGQDRDRQLALSKRHRILRVGRTYERDGGEKGLMFMCLNADIERQFEFLQQTWIGAGLFHGLRSETDPLIAGGTGRRYTIPSLEGGLTIGDLPEFVTMRGGGYFFMPSRRALRFLVDRLGRA